MPGLCCAPEAPYLGNEMRALCVTHRQIHNTPPSAVVSHDHRSDQINHQFLTNMQINHIRCHLPTTQALPLVNSPQRRTSKLSASQVPGTPRRLGSVAAESGPLGYLKIPVANLDQRSPSGAAAIAATLRENSELFAGKQSKAGVLAPTLSFLTSLPILHPGKNSPILQGAVQTVQLL